MDIQEHFRRSQAIYKQISKSATAEAEQNGFDAMDRDRHAFMYGSTAMLLSQLAVSIPDVMRELQELGLIDKAEEDFEVLEIPQFLRRQAD